jgi:hypothetical protein
MSRRLAPLIGLRLLLALGVASAGPVLAGVESFLLEPGSTVGPATEVEPTNCRTAADGSVTCDTRLKNPPGDTPARPNYQPFQN